MSGSLRAKKENNNKCFTYLPGVVTNISVEAKVKHFLTDWKGIIGDPDILIIISSICIQFDVIPSNNKIPLFLIHLMM